jgi:hypothetical protein
VALFEHQQHLLDDLMITDPDLSPAAELVEGYLTIGRHGDAQRAAARFSAATETKGQPWSQGRALRAQGMLAGEDGFAAAFERALSLHEQTPDVFEAARTRLATSATSISDSVSTPVRNSPNGSAAPMTRTGNQAAQALPC